MHEGIPACGVGRLLKRTAAYDEQTFGDTGSYQLMQGRAHFALDPNSDRAR
nr:hypothetical protein [Paracoccus sp. (in: a-proteobacteria)]